MSTFDFDYSLAELLAQKITPRLPEEWHTTLKEIATILDLRDQDLVDYLDAGSFSGALLVTATTGTTTVTATPIALTWETAAVATTSAVTWDAGSNPTRVTFQSGGLWLVTVGISWAATATGVRHLEVKKNGSAMAPAVGCTAPASTAVAPKCSASLLYDSTAGDYLEAWATQDSGTNKTATGHLHAVYLGSTG